MFNDIKQDTQARMDKSIAALNTELQKIRTGRAHPSLLEQIMVDYYGNPTPIAQVANISVLDVRTLSVTPWEKNMLSAIEKAIMTSDLGLNPASVGGNLIRVPLPVLTEERRKDMLKIVRQEIEHGRVSIRNIRRDMNQHTKDLLKAKEITEDDERRIQDIVQKTTNQFIADIDKILADKETELMTV